MIWSQSKFHLFYLHKTSSHNFLCNKHAMSTLYSNGWHAGWHSHQTSCSYWVFKAARLYGHAWVCLEFVIYPDSLPSCSHTFSFLCEPLLTALVHVGVSMYHCMSEALCRAKHVSPRMFPQCPQVYTWSWSLWVFLEHEQLLFACETYFLRKLCVFPIEVKALCFKHLFTGSHASWKEHV